MIEISYDGSIRKFSYKNIPVSRMYGGLIELYPCTYWFDESRGRELRLAIKKAMLNFAPHRTYIGTGPLSFSVNISNQPERRYVWPLASSKRFVFTEDNFYEQNSKLKLPISVIGPLHKLP